MRIVVAPDSFGGTLTAPEAAAAMARGWRRVRPDDELSLVPMSDGGEGLLDVLPTVSTDRRELSVTGPLGEAVRAPFLLRDGTAIVESALACGLALVPPADRDPLRTTTFGVGQLLDAARRAGARRLLVGLGGSATVDGGAGALSALGAAIRRDDDASIRAGARDLARIVSVAPDSLVTDWASVEVELLADVTTVLADAARLFGPQKGASAEDVDELDTGLSAWADCLTRDLAVPNGLRTAPGSGAAGGLGFGLAAGLGARLVPGARRVGDVVGLSELLADADAVVTGEGRLDATSWVGKVVGEVVARAATAHVPVLAVAGSVETSEPALAGAIAASPDGPGPDPATQVAVATARLADDWVSGSSGAPSS